MARALWHQLSIPPQTPSELEADARTRTGDPFITSEVLYQLSYVGEPTYLSRSRPRPRSAPGHHGSRKQAGPASKAAGPALARVASLAAARTAPPNRQSGRSNPRSITVAKKRSSPVLPAVPTLLDRKSIPLLPTAKPQLEAYRSRATRDAARATKLSPAVTTPGAASGASLAPLSGVSIPGWNRCAALGRNFSTEVEFLEDYEHERVPETTRGRQEAPTRR